MNNSRGVIDQGVRWLPFRVEFDSDEGSFFVEIWAVDWAHAVARVDDLKETARVVGESFGPVGH